MSTSEDTLLYVADCLLCLWVMRWGGAQWMEGWRTAFFIDWLLAFRWTAEQIKLYFLLLWICHTAWFLLGMLMPMSLLTP
jgi:hypothetical protein